MKNHTQSLPLQQTSESPKTYSAGQNTYTQHAQYTGQTNHMQPSQPTGPTVTPSWQFTELAEYAQHIRREQRKKRQMRRRLVLFAWQCIFTFAAVLIVSTINTRLRQVSAVHEQVPEKTNAQADPVEQNYVETGDTPGTDYVSLCGLDYVDKPIKRSSEEVLVKLEALAEDNALIAYIFENTELYPDNMLEALANNPEMADFVSGYPDAKKTVTGGLTETEQAQQYPLFLQWDPRWGYVSYGDDSNIGLAGCGPTSLSMALYYLTGNASLTPSKIAEYSMENGYYMSGTGTAWALLEKLPAKYGIQVSHPGISESRMKQALDKGSILICAMKPGDFTAAGHFIVIYGYDEDGFLVNDPNCVARSRSSWSFDKLGSQIKSLWSFEEM